MKRSLLLSITALFICLTYLPIKVEAQSSSCTFHPVAYVLEKKSDGKLYPLRSPSIMNWGVLYDKVAEAYENDLYNWSAFDSLGEFDPCGDEKCTITGDTWGLRDAPASRYLIGRSGGDKADVSLIYDVSAFKIIQQCAPYNKCIDRPNQDAHIIKQIPIECGRDYRFGWVVERASIFDDTNKSCPIDNKFCAPQNPTIEFRNKERIRVGWTNPSLSCTGLQFGSDVVTIDIYDSNNRRICSKDQTLDGADTSTDCVLGRDQTRPNNLEINSLTENETYTVVTGLSNNSCKSPTSQTKAIYKVAPSRFPTNKPTLVPTNKPNPTKSPSCSDGKLDTSGKCDEACCRTDSDCPGTQTCTISNGGCKHGKSCNPAPPPTSGPSCPSGKLDTSGKCDEACCTTNSDCTKPGETCSVSNGGCRGTKSCGKEAPKPTRTPPPPPPPPGGRPQGTGFCSFQNLYNNTLTSLSDAERTRRAGYASCICQRESGSNPFATNDSCLRRVSPEYSLGLFQINIIFDGRCRPMPDNGLIENISAKSCSISNQAKLDSCKNYFFNGSNNIEFTKGLSKEMSDWSHWSTSRGNTCGAF